MKRRVSWLVMPILLVFAGPAGAVLIDFETYPDASPVVSGTEVTNQFASLGVSFGSVASPFADQITNIINWVETTSQFNVLAPGGPAPYHGGQLILSFSPPASAVGSYFIDDQIPVEVVAFDINNAVVGVAASDGSPIGFDNWSIAHQAGIARDRNDLGPLDGVVARRLGDRRFGIHARS